MNSEKVKEIKKIVRYFADKYMTAQCIGVPKRELFADILTLINELESENAELTKAVVDNLDAYRDGFNEGANLNGRVENKWKEENQQLKDRIAELEKENAKLLDSVETVQSNRCVYKCVLTKEHLKQFAEKIAKRLININGIKQILDETLKEFIEC